MDDGYSFDLIRSATFHNNEPWRQRLSKAVLATDLFKRMSYATVVKEKSDLTNKIFITG